MGLGPRDKVSTPGISLNSDGHFGIKHGAQRGLVGCPKLSGPKQNLTRSNKDSDSQQSAPSTASQLLEILRMCGAAQCKQAPWQQQIVGCEPGFGVCSSGS
jgi:hypothetical protein